MIDLHSHLLPGIDDGAKSIEMSLQMARLAVDDGISVMACTPHMMPGVYDNSSGDVLALVGRMKRELEQAGIGLQIVPGADVHVVPDLVSRLDSGQVLPIGRSRYFLLEPPHHVVPPGLLKLVRDLLAAGWTPVLTHPERLTWIENGYDLICQIDEAGAAMQITAGSLTGRFGDRPQYWAKLMLEEGRVDILASDAHDPRRRPPKMSEARAVVAEMLGPEAARTMTLDNPMAILKGQPLPGKQRRKQPRPAPAGLANLLKPFSGWKR